MIYELGRGAVSVCNEVLIHSGVFSNVIRKYHSWALTVCYQVCALRIVQTVVLVVGIKRKATIARWD